MIVTMSKVEIVGPKGLLQEVLALLSGQGVLQIEPSSVGFVEEDQAEKIRSFALDEKTVFERLFLEDLLQKIDRFFSYLPPLQVRTSYLAPESIIGTVAYTIERHLGTCATLQGKKEALQREAAELRRYAGFLGTLDTLFRETKSAPELDFIGLTIKDPAAVEHLKALLARLTGGNYKIFTMDAGDGTLGGLLTVERPAAEKVSRALNAERIVEMTLPDSLDLLSLAGKISFLEGRSTELLEQIDDIDRQVGALCLRWRPIYAAVRQWAQERLSILSASALAFQTKMCFFIYGWLPSDSLAGLRDRLAAAFGSRVLVDEKEVLEGDAERIPVMLRNAPYFRPFEIFTRLLPLPTYTSLDPTPFIGIFFPVIFGMILGDAGYGLVLSVTALVLMRRFRGRPLVRDASKILLVSSAYAFFFGVLYGEFFGDLPERYLGLHPICIERRTAVIPMLYFTLAVGAAHVIIGLGLGVITALKKHSGKEAVYRLLSILTLAGLCVVLAAYFEVLPSLLVRPVILAILILTPFLLFTGGLLAPLELLKSIGNIISYVRIMAIGLTSVLLAFMANNIAGTSGNILIGILVAVLLHLLNLVLGIFSPAVHALRLHYVEFFSKFLEQGGRRFEPLRK